MKVEQGSEEQSAARCRQLGLVPDPPLVRLVGAELAGEDVRGHGLLVLRDDLHAVALALPGHEALLAHESSDALAADALTALDQLREDARAPARCVGSSRAPPAQAAAVAAQSDGRRRRGNFKASLTLAIGRTGKRRSVSRARSTTLRWTGGVYRAHAAHLGRRAPRRQETRAKSAQTTGDAR